MSLWLQQDMFYVTVCVVAWNCPDVWRLRCSWWRCSIPPRAHAGWTPDDYSVAFLNITIIVVMKGGWDGKSSSQFLVVCSICSTRARVMWTFVLVCSCFRCLCSFLLSVSPFFCQLTLFCFRLVCYLVNKKWLTETFAPRIKSSVRESRKPLTTPSKPGCSHWEDCKNWIIVLVWWSQ